MARTRFEDADRYDDDDRDDRDDRGSRRRDRRDDRDDRTDAEIRAAAKAKVKTPALIMMIVGGFMLLLVGYNIATALMTDQVAEFKQKRQEAENDPKLDANGKQAVKQVYDMMETFMLPMLKYQAVLMILPGIIAVLTIMAGAKLKNLSSLGFVRLIAILNMIPCISGCCLIGLPVGLWVISVLGHPDVQATMAMRANDGPSLEE